MGHEKENTISPGVAGIILVRGQEGRNRDCGVYTSLAQNAPKSAGFLPSLGATVGSKRDAVISEAYSFCSDSRRLATEGRDADVVAFAPRPNVAEAALRVEFGSRSGVLLVQGIARSAVANGQILQMCVGLLALIRDLEWKSDHGT
jgi:hypothetical protein